MESYFIPHLRYFMLTLCTINPNDFSLALEFCKIVSMSWIGTLTVLCSFGILVKQILSSFIFLLSCNLISRIHFSVGWHQEHRLRPLPRQEVLKSQTFGLSMHTQKFETTVVINGYKNGPSL